MAGLVFVRLQERGIDFFRQSQGRAYAVYVGAEAGNQRFAGLLQDPGCGCYSLIDGSRNAFQSCLRRRQGRGKTLAGKPAVFGEYVKLLLFVTDRQVIAQKTAKRAGYIRY
jgi:hypothetical protein